MAKEEPLVVQVHVNSDGQQLIRTRQPDKALFQLPQSVRLESSDGYIYNETSIVATTSVHCLVYDLVT